jgi:hypothetical protein
MSQDAMSMNAWFKVPHCGGEKQATFLVGGKGVLRMDGNSQEDNSITVYQTFYRCCGIFRNYSSTPNKGEITHEAFSNPPKKVNDFS